MPRPNEHLEVCPICGYRMYDPRYLLGCCTTCAAERGESPRGAGFRIVRSDGVEFESVKQAARETVNPRGKPCYPFSINQCLEGKQTHAYGYQWSYKYE